MIELKKEFKKKGVNYKQLFKDNVLVIYSCKGHSSNYYEVFRRTTHRPDKFHNDEYELYPYDEAFGGFAWCASNASIVAKVLNNHFQDHSLTKLLEKYITGFYSQNHNNKPIFSLTDGELLQNISNLPG